MEDRTRDELSDVDKDIDKDSVVDKNVAKLSIEVELCRDATEDDIVTIAGATGIGEHGLHAAGGDVIGAGPLY